MKGLVLKGTNNIFFIECEDGITRKCGIKGKILKKSKGLYNPLAAGDFVNIEIDAHDNSEGLILDLIERKNEFIRLKPKIPSPQLLAANIDLLLCVSSCASPAFKPRFIDRILVQAEIQKIPVLIVVNKKDLNKQDVNHHSIISERCEDWKKMGYEVLIVSAKEKLGLDEIIKRISQKTIAVIGQSGVGKTSLLNSICPSLNLKVSEISDKSDKGTHTTTQGECFKTIAETSAGEKHSVNIIDTPGVKSFLISGITKQDLAFYFREMEKLVLQCKFGYSCTHTHEKGCALLEALKNNEINYDRYQSWKVIYSELKK